MGDLEACGFGRGCDILQWKVAGNYLLEQKVCATLSMDIKCAHRTAPLRKKKLWMDMLWRQCDVICDIDTIPGHRPCCSNPLFAWRMTVKLFVDVAIMFNYCSGGE